MPNHPNPVEKAATQNAERRIVKTYFEKITRVIEFKVFAVQADGTGRVTGRGAFEKADLERVAEELADLADDLAEDEDDEEGEDA
jgi:hypothetical protein